MGSSNSGFVISDSAKQNPVAGNAASSNHQSPVTNHGVDSAVGTYLRQHEDKPLLRFITCGSVDDGKSTLIGRLLYESKRMFDDQLAALEADSRRHGTQGERIGYALLRDGLAADG